MQRLSWSMEEWYGRKGGGSRIVYMRSIDVSMKLLTLLWVVRILVSSNLYSLYVTADAIVEKP